MTGDAESALTALYQRLVERRSAARSARRRRSLANGRSCVAASAAAGRLPRRALARARDARRSPAARSPIGFAARRSSAAARRGPPAAEIAEFYRTYAAVPLGEIDGAGTVPGVTPETLLGAIPPELARPAIARALQAAARAAAYGPWTIRHQKAALAELRCTRDRLPVPGAVDLTDWLPFLAP